MCNPFPRQAFSKVWFSDTGDLCKSQQQSPFCHCTTRSMPVDLTSTKPILSFQHVSIADTNEHMHHYVSICETPGSLMPGRALHSASAKTVAILNFTETFFAVVCLKMFETYFFQVSIEPVAVAMCLICKASSTMHISNQHGNL